MANDPVMPGEVSEHVGLFDRFAAAVADLSSRAVFFVGCVLLVVIWAPSILVIRDVDTWQLVINTATTIVTFLLVALLQNSQRRSDQAVQHKLNGIAQALAVFMSHVEGDKLRNEVAELCTAVGLEQRESSSKK